MNQTRPAGPAVRRATFTGHGSGAFDHEVLEIARVTRVVKGGRRFRFRVSVVAGDRAGQVGLGIGRSRDVQQAIQKAEEQARKHTLRIALHDGTIAHTVVAKFKGAKVMLKPAPPGTGIIAGGTVRMVAGLAGIADLVAKRYGSKNRLSNALATLKALTSVSRQLTEEPVTTATSDQSSTKIRSLL